MMRFSASAVQKGGAAHTCEDEAEARWDAAIYARRVRRKIGLSQVAFARRIGAPARAQLGAGQACAPPQAPSLACSDSYPLNA
jgi:hypothetical protein